MGFSHFVKCSQIPCLLSGSASVVGSLISFCFFEPGFTVSFADFFAFILSQYFMVVSMGLSFQQFSVLRETLHLVCSMVFDFDSVATQLCYFGLNHSAPERGLSFCLFLIFFCSDFVLDTVFNSAEIFSLLFFLFADSSLPL